MSLGDLQIKKIHVDKNIRREEKLDFKNNFEVDVISNISLLFHR